MENQTDSQTKTFNGFSNDDIFATQKSCQQFHTSKALLIESVKQGHCENEIQLEALDPQGTCLKKYKCTHNKHLLKYGLFITQLHLVNIVQMLTNIRKFNIEGDKS